MGWTKRELETLERAFKSGAMEVQYDDQVIKYRSLKDMEILITAARRELYEEKEWNPIITPRFIR